MIHSFVNLVSWRFFLKDRTETTVYLDSISIRLLARIFGFRQLRAKSGFAFYSEQKQNLKHALFLTSQPISGCERYYILPFWRNMKDIRIPEELEAELKSSSTVLIGISSPKQDYLALLIEDQFNVKNIYCLGAALYPSENLSNYDSYGINWLLMLIRQPRRTLGKLVVTLKELVLIVVRKEDRSLFRKFLCQIH